MEITANLTARSFARKWPLAILVACVVAGLMALFGLIGINDGGYRTVVQWPNGKLFVKFTEGWYMKAFGTTTQYPNIITFDFDKTEAGEGATLDQPGIAVRYQDGGTGTIYGLARFALPSDEDGMLKLHRAFRTPNGVAHKLIKPITEEGMNLTAGLMTSESAYAEQRGTFTEWSREQISRGKYRTRLKTVVVEDEVTGKKVSKRIPEIVYGDDGQPRQEASEFASYEVGNTGFQITDWNFEPKTLEQISKKREATMAIITSVANAERAKQEAKEAEEQGKKNVTVAKYQKEVVKTQALVAAQQAKEVAVIKAQQKVSVAEQVKLEAAQKRLAAVEYKQEQILIGEGDAERKRLVLEADGALEQKLQAMIQMNKDAWSEAGKQQWVPNIMFGSVGNAAAGSNPAMDMMRMLSIKAAQDLQVDMTMKPGAQQKLTNQ